MSSNTQDYQDFIGGKVPPQAVDLEEVILGAVLLDPDKAREVFAYLKPKHFYSEQNAAIAEAITKLIARVRPVDLLTVKTELQAMEKFEVAGGYEYLIALTNRVGSSAHVMAHSTIVMEKFTLREVIKAAHQLTSTAYDNTADAKAIVSRMYESANEITKATGLVDEAETDLIKLMSAEIMELQAIDPAKGLTGVNTGFKDINRITNGWQKDSLIILAARPAMGKTALALEFAKNAVRSGTKIGFISIEMGTSELVQRVMASEAMVDIQRLRSNKLNSSEWQQVLSKGDDIDGMHIVDNGGMTVEDAVLWIKKQYYEHGIGGVFLDYLQLINVSMYDMSRNDAIGHVTRTLKMTAKELHIPIIALSQLNRGVESRGGNKMPQLSDLRDSGNIEQDADMVLFLHRPEYYGIMQDENGESTAGLAQLKVAKHRSGPVGLVNIRFMGKYTKFVDRDFSQPQAFDG